jgi:hypothetical protein
MKIRLAVWLWSAVMVSGVGTVAQSTATGAFDHPPDGAGRAALPASTPLRVRGTIDKYDPSARSLFLSTAAGTMQFPVASTARARQGRNPIEVSALKTLAGYHATIRYEEAAGHRTVISVHVSEKTGRKPSVDLD